MNRFKFLFVVILFFMGLNSCNQKEKVDLIVTNATVYTVDNNFSKVESFAVSAGNIVEVGTTSTIQKKYISEKIIDASGKFIYPGFNDAHCHFNGYGINLMQYADLRGT